MRIRTIFTIALLVSLTTACSSLLVGPAPVGQFSRQVNELLADGEINKADRVLGEMELYFPETPQMQALYVKLIEAYYKAGDKETAAAAAARFIAMYPEHKNIDYVLYLGGMANFYRGISDMSVTSTVQNSEAARDALKFFDALRDCCQGSIYDIKAQEKSEYLGRLVARYEFGVMRNEFLDGDNTTALLIAQYIVRRFPNEDVAGLAALMVAASNDPMKLKRILDATADADISAREVRALLSGVAVHELVEPALEEVKKPADQPAVAAVAKTVVAPEPVPEELPQIEARTIPPVKIEAPKAPVAVSKPRLFTIQLASHRTLGPLKVRMERLGISDQVSYQSREVNGEVWFSVLYGGYAARAEAKAALPRVRQLTAASDAWIKRMPKTGIVR